MIVTGVVRSLIQQKISGGSRWESLELVDINIA